MLLLDGAEALGVRHRWTDGKRRRLEDVLNDVIVGTVKAAEARKRKQLDDERQERLRQAHREELKQRRRDQEEVERRADKITQHLAAWRKACETTACLDALEKAVGADAKLRENRALAEFID